MARGRGASRDQLTVTARYYDALGDLEQASRAYDELNRAYPQDGSSRHRLAFLHSELGRFDACVTELKQAVQIAPRASQSFFLLGNCHLAMDQVQEARAAYDQALTLKSDPGGRA